MRLLSLFLLPALGATTSLAGAQCEVAKLLPTTPSPQGFLGNWISADGGTLVAGANGFHVGSGRSAVVYQRLGGAWQEVDQLAITGGSTSWSTPVVVDGTTIMLGDVDDSQGAGAVHVFERIGGSWLFKQVLRASQSIPDSDFGRRIVIDGDRAAISAPIDASTQYRGGAVYVFERINGVWSEVERLTAAPAHYFGFYGLGLALEGDVLAVGEPYYLGNSSNLVYLYRHGPTGWTLLTTLTGGGLKFGRALSLENGVLAAGDYQDILANAGSVRLFDGAVGWQQTGIVTASDAGVGNVWDGFGATVLLHQGQLIVGSASPEAVLGEGAYVFRSVGTSWTLSATLSPHGPTGGLVGSQFGSALAADGGDLFVGSAGDDEVLADSGAVYAYEPCGTSYCLSTANSTGAPATISASGSASVAANDLLLRAEPVPNQPGIFFYGPGQATVPFGNGMLCVVGQIARLDVVNAAGNVMTHLVDNTSPPSAATQITPGSTWNFQAWFRDPAAGGAFFNLSDGLQITFCP